MLTISEVQENRIGKNKNPWSSDSLRKNGPYAREPKVLAPYNEHQSKKEGFSWEERYEIGSELKIWYAFRYNSPVNSLLSYAEVGGRKIQGRKKNLYIEKISKDPVRQKKTILLIASEEEVQTTFNKANISEKRGSK